MEITPIGFICVLACLLAVVQPARLGLIVFGAFLPLQTAAAANLPAVGGLSLICAHVIVGALVLGVAMRPKLLRAVLNDAISRPATMIFLAFVLYAVVSAFFMPRVFGGLVNVYSLERPPEGTYGIPLISLHPTSGNITQSFYLIISLFFFSLVSFFVSRRGGLKTAGMMLNAAIIVHLLFAGFSALPPNGVTATLFEMIRTANYSIMPHHTLAGMTRIIGSYAEASAFGSMSVGLFTFSFIRFMQTRGLWFTISSIALLACVAMSFSTTAYAVLGLLVILWSMHTSYKLVRGGLSGEHLTALFVSAVIAIFVVAIFFIEPVREMASVIYERLFGAKLESESGVERSNWNIQGLRNLIDTNGFGVGLGSARTSSLATVLLSNVGVIGALLYFAFLATSFLRAWPRQMPRPKTEEGKDSDGASHLFARRYFVAARGGALAMLLAHIVAGGNIDGGLQFFVFAGIASGAFVPGRRRAPALEVIPPGGLPAPIAFETPAAGKFASRWANWPGANVVVAAREKLKPLK